MVGKESCNFFAKKVVEFIHAHILVACGTVFKAVDDAESSLYTNIACDEHLLKFVKEIIIYSAAAGESLA